MIVNIICAPVLRPKSAAPRCTAKEAKLLLFSTKLWSFSSFCWLVRAKGPLAARPGRFSPPLFAKYSSQAFFTTAHSAEKPNWMMQTCLPEQSCSSEHCRKEQVKAMPSSTVAGMPPAAKGATCACTESDLSAHRTCIKTLNLQVSGGPCLCPALSLTATSKHRQRHALR